MMAKTTPLKRAHLATYDRLSLSNGSRVRSSQSYRAYRRVALKLKPLVKIFMAIKVCLFIPDIYAGLVIENQGGALRLKGPSQPTPFLVQESESSKIGGECGDAKTVDLVLYFKEEPKAWLEGITDLQGKGPCQVSARPLGEGGPQPDARFEIRLSYIKEKQKIRMLTFGTAENFYVDHWFEKETKEGAKSKVAAASAKNAKKLTEPSVVSLGRTSLQETFEDKLAWEKILGSSAIAHDFNTPELDRFRGAKNSFDLGAVDPFVEQQKLQLPTLDLPLMDEAIVFTEESFEIADFPESYVSSGGEPLSPRVNKGLYQGLNFVSILARKHQWLKAQKSMEVLEASEFGKFLPAVGARYPALKGLIYVRLSEELKERAFFIRGMDIWRDALKTGAGKGGSSQEYLEYMALESTRRLFNENKPYAALALLTWARRYSWSPRAEERFAYMRGEAFYRLGIWDESRKYFEEYFSDRSAIPLSAWIDRRLVPSAAFRLGDIYFQNRQFAEANKELSKAMSQMPSAAKFSFESNWYPETVKQFPGVLFNRAETSVRLGNFEGALRDLRAFLFVAPNHPDVGLILYRIGDLLSRSANPDSEKVLGAWRECLFRVPETMGARLCAARKAALDIVVSDRKEWPRLVTTVEEALPVKTEDFWKKINKDDLQVYVDLILADAFIRAGSPTQALFRLDASLKASPNPFLRTWFEEYILSAFAGTLQAKFREGKFKEVIKSYDERKRQILFKQTRAEILWPLALSYKALGLYPQAFETLENAEKVKTRIGRKVARPFDVSPHEWLVLRSELEMELLAQKKIEADRVAATLAKLDTKEAVTHRLGIRFAELLRRKDQELKSWQELEKLDPLSWDELHRYADLLKELGKSPAALKVLEDKVGTLVSEKDKLGVEKMPPAELVMDLAELRVSSKKADRALILFDYLMQLDRSRLGKTVTPSMVAFKRGEALKGLGRIEDARQSFARAKTLSPDSVWGKLATSAEKELR